MNIKNFLKPGTWFRTDGGPRYVQLRNRLADAVQEGVLTPGSPLPPEREIASITDFSRVTVRKAFQDLVGGGVIVQKQGSGSFVSTRTAGVEQNLSRLTSFSEDMARHGKAPSARWLERGLFMPTPEEMRALGLSSRDSVARIVRLRFADEEPMAIERASMPTDILANPLEVETSLYEVLERHGTRPVRAVQRISAINISGQDATLLDVVPGTAGLRIERTSYLDGGRIAEFTQSLFRGDANHLVAELCLPRE